jgi:hypothetical protein
MQSAITFMRAVHARGTKVNVNLGLLKNYEASLVIQVLYRSRTLVHVRPYAPPIDIPSHKNDNNCFYFCDVSMFRNHANHTF